VRTHPLQDNHLRLSRGMILACVLSATWRTSTGTYTYIHPPTWANKVLMDGLTRESISNGRIELATNLMLSVEHNGDIEYHFLIEGLCNVTLGLCCNRVHQHANSPSR
jgi:hypothetical protein